MIQASEKMMQHSWLAKFTLKMAHLFSKWNTVMAHRIDLIKRMMTVQMIPLEMLQVMVPLTTPTMAPQMIPLEVLQVVAAMKFKLNSIC